jgi:hypothetical protein
MDLGVGVNGGAKDTLKIRNPRVGNRPQKIKPGVA